MARDYLSRLWHWRSTSYRIIATQDVELVDGAIERLPNSHHAGRPQVSYFLLAVLIFSILLNAYHLRRFADLDSLCSRHTTQNDSPVSRDIAIHYRTDEFDGSFFNLSTYRLNAGREVDEAWNSLGTDYRPIVIPENEANRYGLAQGQVKIAKEHGGGYIANVEVLHHLHCLNLLRQTTWFNYQHYKAEGKGPFENSEDIVNDHSTHCLDILRQQIMCTADHGVFGQWWVKDIGPFVDFNTKHKCKNFDDIRAWAERHQVDQNQVQISFREGDTVLSSIP